jgi:hypothetical protein
MPTAPVKIPTINAYLQDVSIKVQVSDAIELYGDRCRSRMQSNLVPVRGFKLPKITLNISNP